MRLNEISNNSSRGIYVGARLDRQSIKAVQDLSERLGVPNILSGDAMHTTIIYSRKYVPDIRLDNTKYPIAAKGKKLHIFKTQQGQNSLVLLLNCQGLLDRHNYIMSEYQTTYDYDEYIPHVSISYKSLDFDPNTYEGDFPDLVFDHEYIEPLDLSFAATHS